VTRCVSGRRDRRYPDPSTSPLHFLVAQYPGVANYVSEIDFCHVFHVCPVCTLCTCAGHGTSASLCKRYISVDASLPAICCREASLAGKICRRGTHAGFFARLDGCAIAGCIRPRCPSWLPMFHSIIGIPLTRLSLSYRDPLSLPVHRSPAPISITDPVLTQKESFCSSLVCDRSTPELV